MAEIIIIEIIETMLTTIFPKCLKKNCQKGWKKHNIVL